MQWLKCLYHMDNHIGVIPYESTEKNMTIFLVMSHLRKKFQDEIVHKKHLQKNSFDWGPCWRYQDIKHTWQNQKFEGLAWASIFTTYLVKHLSIRPLQKYCYYYQDCHWLWLWSGSLKALPYLSVWLCVCSSVCAIVKHHLLGVLENTGQRTYC